MGTAFGLDAITTIQPETAAEAAARERAAPPRRMRAPAAPSLHVLARRRSGSPQTSMTSCGRCAAGSPRLAWPRELQTTRVGPPLRSTT